MRQKFAARQIRTARKSQYLAFSEKRRNLGQPACGSASYCRVFLSRRGTDVPDQAETDVTVIRMNRSGDVNHETNTQASNRLGRAGAGDGWSQRPGERHSGRQLEPPSRTSLAGGSTTRSLTGSTIARPTTTPGSSTRKPAAWIRPTRSPPGSRSRATSRRSSTT